MTTDNTQQLDKNANTDGEVLHFDQDFTEKTTSPNDEDTLLICDHDDLLETKVIKVSNFLKKGDTKVIYGKLENSKDNQILAYKEGNIANVEVNNVVNSLVEKTSSPDDNDTLLVCDNKDNEPKKIKASTLFTKGDTKVVYAKLKDIKNTQILSYKDGNITNVNIKDLVNFNGFVLKHSVETVADLPTAFPNPLLGWASLVKKADLVHYPTGVIYVYTTKEDGNNNDWVKFNIMSSPNIVEDLDMKNFDIKNSSDIYCNSIVAKDYSSVLEKCYPVGSIYINSSNQLNPKDLLGFGTWETFGGGRVPVGVNSNDNLFNTGEKTGGKADSVLLKHTHATQEDGHTHFIANTNEAGDWTNNDPTDLKYNNYKYLLASRGEDTKNAIAENYALGASSGYPSCGYTSSDKANIAIIETGEDPKNSNLQPYITVYMWKRIS